MVLISHIPQFDEKLILNELVKRIAPTLQPNTIDSFRTLWTRSGLSSTAFADRLANLLSLERVSFETMATAPSLADRFSSRFLKDFDAFPFSSSEGRPILAVAEPPASALLKSAQIILGQFPKIVIASYDDLATIVAERLSETASTAAEASDTLGVDDDVESLRDLASGAPVVRALNDLFEKAVESRATDLHIEPMRDIFSVRLRVDGILRNIPSPPRTMVAALLSRIKILAGLNIAERRLPQDGAARLRVQGTQIDVRVAILPTPHGEAAVIRFLPRDRGLLDVERLGLDPDHEKILRRLIKMPNGMIIITGPTGSGKTTTLAAVLSELNEPSRKILTVEDPIEYELPGIVQTQVAPSIGLTFATALRSFLRFDPNVIMLGEVRDGETASIAVQAALTGHLVLTTLHTETAAAAIPRLIDLGVDDFLLQSTLRGIIAQRLVRILCDHCKVQTVLTEDLLTKDPRFALLGLTLGETVCEPKGCDRCGGSGYRGRSGVFEMLEITSELRPTIQKGVDGPSIEAQARTKGFKTMMEDAVHLCRQKRTSAEEVLRVTAIR
ncbi:MAG: GspE/PulE family protein [Hyphomicrobium sp.]